MVEPLMVMETVSVVGGRPVAAEIVPVRVTEAVPYVIVCEARLENAAVALFTVSVVLVSVAVVLFASPL